MVVVGIKEGVGDKLHDLFLFLFLILGLLLLVLAFDGELLSWIEDLKTIGPPEFRKGPKHLRGSLLSMVPPEVYDGEKFWPKHLLITI